MKNTKKTEAIRITGYTIDPVFRGENRFNETDQTLESFMKEYWSQRKNFNNPKSGVETVVIFGRAFPLYKINTLLHQTYAKCRLTEKSLRALLSIESVKYPELKVKLQQIGN